MRELKLKIEGMEFNVPVFEQNGKNLVALKPLCEALGVQFERQRKKVENSEFLVPYICTAHDSSGRKQEMVCVQIECIGEWIFGINPNKVKPEIREKLILFRQKLQIVLYNAVQGNIDVNMVDYLTKRSEEQAQQIRELLDLVKVLFAEIHQLKAKDNQHDIFLQAEASAAGKILRSHRIGKPIHVQIN